MPRFLLLLAAFVVVLYALIDVIQTPSPQMRTLPKPVWLLVVVLVPVLGAVGWFLLGRPARDTVGGGRPWRSRPTAPDDDPAFLRSIDDTTWSQRMRQRRERRTDDTSADDNGPAPLA